MADQAAVERGVIEALRTCHHPEIPVTDASVDVVFDPAWDSCKMSDAARLKPGLL
jgi:metal-sulfur cluster biosynthetic enzyme